MGVTSFLLLSSLGLAIAQAQDCSKPVPGPNMNLRGNDILLSTFQNGAKVNFACNPGYTPAGGSSSITCTNGIWSPVTLVCAKKSCGSAGEVTNGNVEYVPDNEFGGTAVVKCNTGYNPVGGSRVTCEDQGWTGRLPVCEVVPCESPPVIENGYYRPVKDGYIYSENIIYSCNSGYTLIGANSRTCSSDGKFTPDSPTCSNVECAEPVIDNGQWMSGARPPYRPSSAVTLQCKSGYTMKGEAIQTCDVSGKWSPGLPKCEIECTEPVVENGQQESGARPPYRPTSAVTLKCNSGYTMKGESIQTCDVSGKWSPGLPKCEKPATTKATNIITTTTPTTTTTTTTPSTMTPTGGGTRTGTIVGAVVGTILFIAICGLGWYFGFRKKKQTGTRKGYRDSQTAKDEETVVFS